MESIGAANFVLTRLNLIFIIPEHDYGILFIKVNNTISWK